MNNNPESTAPIFFYQTEYILWNQTLNIIASSLHLSI